MVDVLEPGHDLRGPLVDGHPADVVDVVVLHEQCFVRRFPGLAVGLHPLDLGQRVLVHGGHQDLLGVGVVGRDAGHHVGDHQADQRLGVGQGVLDGEHAAPGLAVEDEAVQPQRQADLLDLVDEAVDLPQ